MFNELLIHTRTRLQLDQFLSRPTHGIILTGPTGSGRATLARALAAALLHLPEASKLESYPYFSLVDPSENTITIDEIRGLQKLLTLRTPRGQSGAIQRIIIIVGAERMRSEAQNAFLKSLEEPPADTCIILTSEGNGGLLPTIYSRVQQIEILPVSEEQAHAYFTKRNMIAADFASNYALSQGQVGLLCALIDKKEHELRSGVEMAKKLLRASIGERLLQSDELSKDKQGLVILLNSLQRIAHAALLAASKTNKKESIKRWHDCMSAIQRATKSLEYNANTKLLIDDLLLNL